MFLAVGGLSACGPDKEKIMQKTIDGIDSIRSAELDSDMKVKTGNGRTSRNSHIKMDITYTSRPEAAKVVMKTEASGNKSIVAMSDGRNFYCRMASDEKWYRRSVKCTDAITGLSKQCRDDASSYLRMMRKCDADCDVMERGGSYVLTFNAGKKAADELKKEVIKRINGSDSKLTGSYLKKVSFSKLRYVISVDRKSFLPEKYKIDLTMTSGSAGRKLTISEVCTGTYMNVNKVKKLTMPTDYIDFEN